MTETKSSESTQEAEGNLPFLTHLVELRDRLMKSVLVVLVITLILLPFSREIYHLFADPVLAQGGKLISIQPVGAVISPFLLVIVIAIFFAMPFLLYQAWAFIAPGLYKHEKRLAFPLMISSIALFYAGVAFAFFVVIPIVFNFVMNYTPSGVEVMPDVSSYLYFALKMFFAFGVAFEVPIATILLVAAGITTPDSLASKRPYIIVGAFIVGMLLTPPDVISQTLLALPMWLLFEAGVFFSRIIVKRREEEEEKELTDEEMEAELDRAIADEEQINKGE